MMDWLMVESGIQTHEDGSLTFDVTETKKRVRSTFMKGGRTDHTDLLVENAVLYITDNKIQSVNDASVKKHSITCFRLGDLQERVPLGLNYGDQTVVIAVRSSIIPEDGKAALAARPDFVNELPVGDLGQNVGDSIKLAACAEIGAPISELALSDMLMSELANPKGTTAGCLQRLGIATLKRMVDLSLNFTTIDDAVNMCSSLVPKDQAMKMSAIAHKAEMEAIRAKIDLYQAKSELAEYQRKFYLSQMQHYQSLQQAGRI